MKPKIEQRPIDRIYNEYQRMYEQAPYANVLYPAILLLSFGILACIWFIPFPYIAFLGKYNGFVNWASFLIAGVVYYCLRLSPLVSYGMLFLFFGYSYGIIQLEGWEKNGGLALWACGMLSLLAGLMLVLVNYIKMREHFELSKFVARSIAYGPLWMLVGLCKTLGLRY
jgi:hypothetical protein